MPKTARYFDAGNPEPNLVTFEFRGIVIMRLPCSKWSGSTRQRQPYNDPEVDSYEIGGVTMGNSLSGWHGRRSRRPYFDELARLSIGECKSHAPGVIGFSADGRQFTARAILVTVGCMTVPRFVCPTCDQVCRVLYVVDTPRCHHCAGARYRSQSQSRRQRALCRAEKILDQFKKAVPGRSGKKPKWMRWGTYKRHKDEARAVMLTIVSAAESQNKAFQSSIGRMQRLARTTKT